jgi:hypothetical protein
MTGLSSNQKKCDGLQFETFDFISEFLTIYLVVMMLYLNGDLSG